jgi:hypothetical protein
MLIYKNRTARHKENIKAYIFGIGLLLMLGFSILTGVSSAGPIVLGSEINGNGMMEYMCLGNGCDQFNDFKWSDK